MNRQIDIQFTRELITIFEIKIVEDYQSQYYQSQYYQSGV